MDLLSSSSELQFGGLETLNVSSETETKPTSEEPDLLDLLGGLELDPQVSSSTSFYVLSTTVNCFRIFY